MSKKVAYKLVVLKKKRRKINYISWVYLRLRNKKCTIIKV